MKRRNTFLRCFVMILSVTMIIALAACNRQEEQTKPGKDDIASKVTGKLPAYRTDLEDSANTMISDEYVKDYLTYWAKSKGIRQITDEYGNIIFDIPTSEQYEKANQTVIVCPYSHQNFRDEIIPLSMALYAARNNESAGRLTIIFTPEGKHDFLSLKNINPSHIADKAKIFYLSSGTKALIGVSAGASSGYLATIRAKRSKPKYALAYRIRITVPPGGKPDIKISDHTNPILTLTSLLNNLQDKNMEFELATINGGQDTVNYATSASMIIAIDPNDKEKFSEIIDIASENFEKNHINSTYICKRVKTPKSVITEKSRSTFISYMYTLLNGEYKIQNEDLDYEAITSISFIRSDIANIKVGSVAYSLDKKILKKIDQDEAALCRLSGIYFHKTFSTPLWTARDNTDFTNAYSKAFKKHSGKNLTYRPVITASGAPYLVKKGKDVEIINITVNNDVVEECLCSIIQYMVDLADPTEKDAL